MNAIDPVLYGTLSQEEKLLTNWAAEGKEMTVKDAQDVLGTDWRGAKTVLDSLTEKRILIRPPGKDRDRHRKWSLRKRR